MSHHVYKQNEIEELREQMRAPVPLTGNPDGVTAPEIPDPPACPWTPMVVDLAYVWERGWRAGYEAALLDWKNRK